MFAVYVKNLHECIIKRTLRNCPPSPSLLWGHQRVLFERARIHPSRVHRFTPEQKLSDCRLHLGYAAEKSLKKGSVS